MSRSFVRTLRVLAAVGSILVAASCKTAPTTSPPSPPLPVQPVPSAAAEAEVPQTPVPDLVGLEATLAHRFVRSQTPGEVLARLTVTADALPNQPRPQANLSLVIDTSASMRGEAISRATQAALALVDDLEPGDRISVVAFHSRGEVLVPSTEIDEATRTRVRAAIEAMEAKGTTALAEGMALGLAELRASQAANVATRMVLLSDGVPNDVARTRAVGATLASSSVSLTALGLGVEFDETLLGELASASGGRFHFLERGDQLAEMFEDEVLQLERLVARGSQLQLRAGPGVSILEVVGQPGVPSGARTVSVPVGDLVEHGRKELVVRLSVGSHRPGAMVELLDADLSYADATQAAGQRQVSAFLGAEATSDLEALEASRDPQTELVIVRALTASAALRVVDLARRGQLQQARRLLDSAAKRGRKLAESQGDETLAALVEDLGKLRGTLAALVPQQARAKRGSPKGKVAPSPSPAGGVSSQQALGLKRSHSRAFGVLH